MHIEATIGRLFEQILKNKHEVMLHKETVYFIYSSAGCMEGFYEDREAKWTGCSAGMGKLRPLRVLIRPTEVEHFTVPR